MAKIIDTQDGRVINYGAGPSCLPVEVLKEIQNELVNYSGTGMSVMEISHRSKEAVKMFEETKANLRSLLELKQSQKILFLQGGATLQFSAVPLNLLGSPGNSADYLITGIWSHKAYKEAAKYGNPVDILKYESLEKERKATPSSLSTKLSIPELSDFTLSKDAKYLHYCSNETIHGVEFQHTPFLEESEQVPLVCDASSNFCSKPMDASKHAVIFAGAQKNVGCAGCTVVIVDENYAGKELSYCPSYLSYDLSIKADSVQNTPPVWGVYLIQKMTKFIASKGGLAYWDEISRTKSQLLYDCIDSSDAFYKNSVDQSCRSRMSIPFTVADDDPKITADFLSFAGQQGLYNLSGHRLVGGCRAALYNGMTLEGTQSLVDVMKEFQSERL